MRTFSSPYASNKTLFLTRRLVFQEVPRPHEHVETTTQEVDQKLEELKITKRVQEIEKDWLSPTGKEELLALLSNKTDGDTTKAQQEYRNLLNLVFIGIGVYKSGLSLNDIAHPATKEKNDFSKTIGDYISGLNEDLRSQGATTDIFVLPVDLRKKEQQ